VPLPSFFPPLSLTCQGEKSNLPKLAQRLRKVEDNKAAKGPSPQQTGTAGGLESKEEEQGRSSGKDPRSCHPSLNYHISQSPGKLCAETQERR